MSLPHLRRTGGALTAAGLALAAGGLGLGPGTSSASSHREAPLTAANPLVDNTDTYAFVSPDKPDTTTLIANCSVRGSPTLFRRCSGECRRPVRLPEPQSTYAPVHEHVLRRSRTPSC